MHGQLASYLHCTCTLYERLKLAEHFAANFMKINGNLRKLYGFKHFGGVHHSLTIKKLKISANPKQI